MGVGCPMKTAISPTEPPSALMAGSQNVPQGAVSRIHGQTRAGGDNAAFGISDPESIPGPSYLCHNDRIDVITRRIGHACMLCLNASSGSTGIDWVIL